GAHTLDRTSARDNESLPPKPRAAPWDSASIQRLIPPPPSSPPDLCPLTPDLCSHTLHLQSDPCAPRTPCSPSPRASSSAPRPPSCARPRPPAPPPPPPGLPPTPAGEFPMGTDDPKSMANERPAHKVRISAFWMDERPVTNAQFAAFVNATGYLTTAERP